ncbi:MAG: LemA family protein [Robiginitomaculum sp.]
MPGMFFLILIVVLVVIIGALYNGLVKSRQLARAGWSDIDVQLKRRADLIPRLVSVVQGYAKHERDLFIDITQRRMAAMTAGEDPKARAGAEAALGRSATKLIALAEDYPDLKASENFLDLQNQLLQTEDKIEMARRFYNGAVRELNIKVKTVPSNFIAGPFGFKTVEYFEADESDRSVPNV